MFYGDTNMAKKTKTIRWVCGECGSNNMSHRAPLLQCTVCGKIRTVEPLTVVDTEKVIDAAIDNRVRFNLDNFKCLCLFWIKKFVLSYMGKFFGIIVILSIIVVITSVYSNDETINNIYNNIKQNCYEFNVRRLDLIYTQIQNEICFNYQHYWTRVLSNASIFKDTVFPSLSLLGEIGLKDYYSNLYSNAVFLMKKCMNTIRNIPWDLLMYNISDINKVFAENNKVIINHIRNHYINVIVILSAIAIKKR